MVNLVLQELYQNFVLAQILGGGKTYRFLKRVKETEHKRKRESERAIERERERER